MSRFHRPRWAKPLKTDRPDVCPTCGFGLYQNRWVRRRKGGITRVPEQRRSFRVRNGEGSSSIRVYWAQPVLGMRYSQCRDEWHQYPWRRMQKEPEAYDGLNRHDADKPKRAKNKARRQKAAQGKDRR